MAPRRFDRKETALILRRATDGEGRPAQGGEAGLTLEEITAAAVEAGIDPAAVRRAAAVVPVRADPFQRWALGAPVTPVARGRFQGRLAPERDGALQAAIERALGRHGQLERDGDEVVWTEEHGFGRTTVRVRQDGPEVEVVAEAERRGHLLGLLLGLATLVALLLLPLGGFGGLAARSTAQLAVLAPLALIAVGTRLAWPLLQRPIGRRLESAVLEAGAALEGDLPAP